MIEKFTIKKILDTYQCDRYGFIRPIILMNELQSAADNHAEYLGVGRSFCIENNIAWVVTHYLIDILELPRENQKLNIITWPSLHTGVKACRDFQVFDDNGKLLINATSQWVLIDTEKRSLIRLNEFLPDFELIGERALDRKFEHFPEFQPQKTHVFKCRYDDVDVNQHINNALYTVWATESVGFDFRNTHKLVGLELNFKKEINSNTEEVLIDTEITGSESHHKIKTGDIEHADVICKWEKI